MAMEGIAGTTNLNEAYVKLAEFRQTTQDIYNTARDLERQLNYISSAWETGSSQEAADKDSIFIAMNKSIREIDNVTTGASQFGNLAENYFDNIRRINQTN